MTDSANHLPQIHSDFVPEKKLLLLEPGFELLDVLAQRLLLLRQLRRSSVGRKELLVKRLALYRRHLRNLKMGRSNIQMYRSQQI